MKSFWNEAIGSYIETTLWISRSHSFDTSRHFYVPKKYFLKFRSYRNPYRLSKCPPQALPAPENATSEFIVLFRAASPCAHSEQHKSSMHHSILYVLSLRILKILSSRLYLHVFLKDFPNKTLYAFLFSPLLVTCPTELIG